MNVVLASASLRRQELLKRIIEDYRIITSDFDEDNILFKGDCSTYVMELAKGKAENVLKKVKEDSIIIGCDTVVFLDEKILGKPNGEEEAYKMLKALSGNTHKVYSGMAIINSKTKEIITDFEVTEVLFSKLSDDEIYKYIKSGEPMDKAGAYGIQGFGGVFVESIKGCFYNVVGLPLNKLNKLLKGWG